MALASLEFGSGNDASMAAYRKHLRRYPRERCVALGVIIEVCKVDAADAAFALGMDQVQRVAKSYAARPADPETVQQFATLVYAIFRKVNALHMRARFRMQSK